MARSPNHVAKVYQTVIDDVINNVREAFLDDGVDEQVLHELKQIWENKLDQTKAVSSPVLGDRASRPPMFTYVAQPSGQQGVSQSVMYQTIQTQNVQLSGAAQQARLAIPAVYQQQQQSANLVHLPTQQGQQVYAAYQPAVVIQQQIAPHQARPSGASGQTLVLTTTTQASVGQQQQVTGQQQQQQPSAIIQVDGSSDLPADEDVPCSSGLRIQERSTKIHKLKKHPVRKTKAKKVRIILQVDGGCDTSSEEDDDEDDDDEDDDEDDNDDDETNEEEEQNDEEPLCSDDDDSDQDAKELFDTDNVVVCQYDKIHRAKAKWKFNLKVGIMNLKSKDYVFQKATGEAEW